MKTVVFFIASFPALAGVLLVQSSSVDTTAVHTTSLKFPVANAQGNFIVVCSRAGATNTQSFTVTDSNGNVYQQAVKIGVPLDPTSETLVIFYAENIKGGVNTVTVSDNTDGTMRVAILEYSGVALSGSLDAVASAQGVSSSPNSGAAITTANGDLVIGAISTSNAEIFSSTPGYIVRDRVPLSGTKLIAEDQIQVAAGAIFADVTLGASDPWGAAVAAFRPAVGGPPPPPPSAPSIPVPATGTANKAVNTGLFWAASTNTTSYDVFLGTVSPPPFTANVTVASYQPSVLTSATTYFWFVTAKGSGGISSSPVWSFTTSAAPPPVPSAPSNPVPTSGSTGVPVTSTLSWTASTNATSYDVFFGQSSVPPFVVNMTGTSYSPGTLLYGTAYNWSVTAKGAGGNTASPAWSFTTAAAPPPLPSITSFTAVPATVNAGQSTTLSWQTLNATSVSIDLLGAEQANGSVIVSPLLSTTYTLTALNSSASVTSQVIVTVIPTPPLSTKTFSVGNMSCTLTNNGSGVLNAVCTVAGVQVSAGSLRTTDLLPTALILYPSSGLDSIFILAWPNPSGFTWQATIDQGPSQSGTL